MKQLVYFGIALILTGCFGKDPEKTGKEGKPVPDFSLLLTDSITWIHSRNIPGGKPFVLFYYSPYCPYCKAQTRAIIENMDDFKDINFYYISGYPLASIKDYVKEFDLKKYPNIIVGLDSARSVSDYFEIPAFPYLAIYGKDKKLNKTYVGKIYNSQLKKAAEE